MTFIIDVEPQLGQGTIETIDDIKGVLSLLKDYVIEARKVNADSTTTKI
jgi:hypothetical protein